MPFRGARMPRQVEPEQGLGPQDGEPGGAVAQDRMGEQARIRFARYENRLDSGRGDEYQEFYAGVNWYLYGHKAKLQAGVQYTMMDDAAGDGGDYSGWGVTTGLRISW